MVKRSTFHHGDLRRALVDATLELLETEEVGSISLREVARRAGVSSGAPYHHFPTRADLLSAVAMEGFVALSATLERVDRGSGTALERLERRFLTYMRFAAAHGAHYRVMFHDELRHAASAEQYDEVARAAFDALVAAVQAARPDLSDETVRELSLTAWSAAHGAALLAIDRTFDGLTARRSTTRSVAAVARRLREMIATAREA